MLPPPADRPKLAATLGQLSAAVEELLLGGLTTASAATRQSVQAALQEAARFRLLRLGSTLRGVADELDRFAKQDVAFSKRRLMFFLGRSWLLGRGLAHALTAGDEAEYDRLTWAPPTQPLPAAEVVCLGAVKKVSAAAVLFDFRLRAVDSGRPMTWSAVFPVKPGTDIPPEGYLHLPQKQKFHPMILLGGTTVHIQNAAVSADGRVSLGEASTVTAGAAFADWARFLAWSPGPARGRIAKQNPGPLDLDTELQEEVVLREYDVGEPTPGGEPGQTVCPVAMGQLVFRTTAGAGAEGAALRKGFDELRKRKRDRPPLYGLMHYEKCTLAFQPLTAFRVDGPDYLTISKENVNRAALLKALSFK